MKLMKCLKGRLRMTTRVIVATVRGFWKDDCYSKASTLTFYTLQSIVPFLAVTLGIAKGFGLDKYLEQLVVKTFFEQKEVFAHVFQFAQSMLRQIKGGVVAGFGIIFLLWTNIGLLGYIENALNQIWKIKTERTFFQKVKDYLAIIILCPILFVASSGLTVFFRSQISYLQSYSMFTEVSDVGLWFFKFVPLLFSCLLFAMLYFLMPNTKITFWPRMIGAIFAGIVFQLWQSIFIVLQIKIFNYNAVYGSLALLPLFLIWLQVSWLIALIGAEISSHIENDVYYDETDLSGDLENVNKRQLGLLITYYCMKSFFAHTPPLSDVQIARILKIPINTTHEILEQLVQGNILTPIKAKDTIIGYNPLYDPSRFKVKTVCDAVQKCEDFEIISEVTEPLKQVTKILNDFEEASEHSKENLDLKTAVEKIDKARYS